MSDLIKAIAVTAELMGTEWSKDAAKAIAEELSIYPLESVKVSLSRCRKELRGKLTLTDILDRLPGGHPGVEEAWAIIAPSMNNEAVTLVWTPQISAAYGVACGVSDDKVQARMAFKEKYLQLVSEARAKGETPKWTVSLGHDRNGREGPVVEAVRNGWLTADHALKLIPQGGDAEHILRKLLGDDGMKRIA